VINNRDQRLFDTNYALDLWTHSALSPSMPSYQLGLNGGTLDARRFSRAASTVNANHVVTSYTTAANPVNIGSATAPELQRLVSNILGVQRRDFQYNQQSRYYHHRFRLGLSTTCQV
jgi:iron complex outermembrane recepter protein